ncbi:hypothetical protein ACLB2K_071600 [Fragaria x ananassa]
MKSNVLSLMLVRDRKCQMINYNRLHTLTVLIDKPIHSGQLMFELIVELKSLRTLTLDARRNRRSLWIESIPKKIGELVHLRYLDLSGNERLEELPSVIVGRSERLEPDLGREIMNGLEPHQGLESSTIYDYEGTLSRWLSSLHSLRVLTLRDYDCQVLPSLGKLASLESLEIRNLYGVEKITIMPCLSELTISMCDKLKALPDFLWNTPLQNLTISYCLILENLYTEEIGEQWAKISHIPKVGWELVAH